jgi:pimeloyl-ACP methyl ester carboxylesterase
MATPNTTFIFVPGAFSPAHYFHKVTSLLASQGYSARAVDLPSMDASLRDQGKQPGMYDDAAHVRSIITASLDDGHDVVVVGSSYGGAVSMEACKGVKRDQGELKHLVLLGSLLADTGFTIKELIGGNLPIDVEAEMPDSAAYVEPIDPAIAGMVLCGSLSKEEQDAYAAMGKPISAKAFLDPLTFAAWKEVPTTLVVGSKDLALPAEKQVEYFDKAVEKGAKEARKVVIEGGDHLTMLSYPEEVVKVCLEAAGVSV